MVFDVAGGGKYATRQHRRVLISKRLSACHRRAAEYADEHAYQAAMNFYDIHVAIIQSRQGWHVTGQGWPFSGCSGTGAASPATWRDQGDYLEALS
ncbi:hypothetical protein ABE571_07320 [Stenotrophomonas sp. TWI273]|jgi:hypothetical protein|uniref:hypothetical protein n=1 Tax=unclassified Stenotrophomonas TaxID=196198 RepID=UPI0028A87C3E|nr:hypothetical protein [Stenotrophomonas sp.]